MGKGEPTLGLGSSSRKQETAAPSREPHAMLLVYSGAVEKSLLEALTWGAESVYRFYELDGENGVGLIQTVPSSFLLMVGFLFDVNVFSMSTSSQ